MEPEVERANGIVGRIDFYRSSHLCYETLWRWGARSSCSYKFAAIVDALGWLKALFSADSRCVDTHQNRELERAEGTLMQALHFTKRARDYLLCSLSLANMCRHNVDAGWCDT